MMFFFLSVSIRCLTKDKLKKRKHGKHIFLKQYAFQTKGSSAVDESQKQKIYVDFYFYYRIAQFVRQGRW